MSTAARVSISPKRPGADRYVELAYTAAAKSLDPGQFAEIDGGVCLPGEAKFNQGDDYSYTGSSAFETTSKVVLLKDGVRIWGDEP